MSFFFPSILSEYLPSNTENKFQQSSSGIVFTQDKALSRGFYVLCKNLQFSFGMNNNTTLDILHSQSINVQHFAMCFLFVNTRDVYLSETFIHTYRRTYPSSLFQTINLLFLCTNLQPLPDLRHAKNCLDCDYTQDSLKPSDQ